jgi:hypothetical protein
MAGLRAQLADQRDHLRIGVTAGDAQLDGGDIETVDQHLRLVAHQLGIERMHGEHADVVLHRQRRGTDSG